MLTHSTMVELGNLGKLILNWEQMFSAISALSAYSDVCLRMRKPGDWYVSAKGIEVTDGHLMSSGGTGGRGPESAIEAYWQWLTTLQPEEAISVSALGTRKHFRWNGFMWAEVERPSA